MSKHEFEDGTKRVKKKDLKQYEKSSSSWILCDDMCNSTKNAISLYMKNDNLEILKDELSKEFLKGFLTKDMIPSGKRVQQLPDGRKLARGAFSLFAKNLRFNFDGDFEWDVCYENTSGSMTYLYCEDKIHLEKKKKAKLVDKFMKNYEIIMQNLEKDLKKKKTTDYLALYTLVITKIRVGNLEHYNHLGHRGLTTLQKNNINIDGDIVTFDFIGKDAVPRRIEKEFPKFYIDILKELLLKKKKSDFIFADGNGLPLHSEHLSRILFEYTGEHFYPHIIRSYHADMKCKEFFKKRRKAKKQEIIDKFKEIAQDLGHMKYNKKKGEWEVSYKVTVDSYIRPEYVQRMQKLYEK